MNHLPRLFRLLQITRAQPQYGYVFAEIPKSDISDLAQHHYLVTAIAWQLGRNLRKAGAKIDLEKVIEYSLIHDLGELFGGDISMPYAKANPIARQAAKVFEAENHKYLAQFFDEDSQYFMELAKEVMDAQTDECRIAKIADYIEVIHYKLYVHRLSKNDITFMSNRIRIVIDKMKDKVIQVEMKKFVDEWVTQLGNGILEELFESVKAEKE